jgi:transcriptional regulator with XRE-family HTH domain
MFNTKKFGAYLSRLRKNADMTQSELAEKLNLTRQAVSKYETGDSFPDVSILIQIAEIFEITLDELINSGNPTKGETKIIKNVFDGDGENLVAINDLVNLAPLIKPSVLGAFSKKLSEDGIDISHIVSLVQFLNDNDLLQLINSAEYSTLNEELLEKIAPFLDMASKEAIVKKIIEGEDDWRLLKGIIPYIEDMTGQLEAAFVDGALPKEAHDMLNEYWISKNRK